ncbi:hypothetical protein ES703_45370 [subsurface metagenome]
MRGNIPLLLQEGWLLHILGAGGGHIWLRAIEQNRTTGEEIFGKVNSLLGCQPVRDGCS